MTMGDKKTETLNAYVDGELAGVEAAAFLRELAGDRDLARRVAELTILKSAVQESFDDIPCHEHELQKILNGIDANAGGKGLLHRWVSILRQGVGRREPGMFMGAGAALIVMVLATVFFFWQVGGTARDEFFTDAVQAHSEWLQQAPSADTPAGHLQLAAFQQRNEHIYVPDLSASKLRIGLVKRFGDEGVQVGYVGTRNCHLSLFIQPSNALRNLGLTEESVRDARVFSWRENQLDYALLAIGMDQSRLRLIASDVLEATRLMKPFDSTTQMALRLNRQQSQPCAA